ncbi:MAG: hypothetical protein PVH65_00775 [Chloroflexota bacterium]|jgi:hypothetical protein
MKISQHARESILAAQVDAALSGHDLAGFEPVQNQIADGWQAVCRRCGQSVWVSKAGPLYSLLDARCPGRSET